MIKFGTDGWRAIIADEFTFSNVKIVSQAFADYIGHTDKPVIIGYDNRFLSEKFAAAAADVVSSNGIKVLLTECSCPSQVVSFHVKKKNAAAGIMITASHNPPQWNGFKVKGYYGGSATPQITKEIESNLDYSQKPKKGKKGPITIFNPKEGYIEHVASLVDLDLISKSGIKIIVDPMFGSGTGYLAEILKDKIQIEEINDVRDPYFGGVNPEPIAVNLKKLLSICKEKHTVGIALDGDADRIGAVGSDGVFINTHQIFALLLKHLVKNKKWDGSVVKTFNLTQLIDSMCAKYNLNLCETPIGFKYICDMMLEHNILLGGEESGGVGIKNHIPERDGILSALLLIELMACEKKTLEAVLDDISKEFRRYFYGRVDLYLDKEKKDEIVKSLTTKHPIEFGKIKVMEVETMDGIKLFLEDESWILFRASGTEPLLRIYCEALSPEKVEFLLEEGRKLTE